MAGRPRKHPITDSIRTLKEGDNILVRRRRSSHLIEMQVNKIKRLWIIAFFGRENNQKKYTFHRVSGNGYETEFQIVACGARDIERYRKDFAGGKRVRKSIVPDFNVEPPPDSASLPVNRKYRDQALIVARRVYLHFCAGQFDACNAVINQHKKDAEVAEQVMRYALQVRGVDQPLSLLGMPTKLVNALERFGIHTIAQFCNADRDYLLDHVPQFNRKRLSSACKLLDHLGFEHKLYEPEYYKTRENSDDSTLDEPIVDTVEEVVLPFAVAA